MARIRTIKPEFFTSEDIVELSAYARLLYIAVWCEADRAGRLVWKPKTLKLRYFPADDVAIQELCDELIKAGLVKLYGDGLAFIPKFLDHQHVNPREAESTLPPPNQTSRDNDASARVDDASERDDDAQVGREGKGKIDMSGKPDVIDILSYLNQRAKRDYRAVDSNLRLIAARLGEGASVADCKAVIDAKVSAWKDDPKMNEYLRPETLFNATKFAQYIGALRKAAGEGNPAFKGAK